MSSPESQSVVKRTTKDRFFDFFKSSERKESKESATNEFFEDFDMLDLKKQIQIEFLIGDFIDHEGYPHSEFTQNFLSLFEDKEQWEKMFGYLSSRPLYDIWKDITKHLEVNKQGYNPQELEKIQKEFDDFLASISFASPLSEKALKDRLLDK